MSQSAFERELLYDREYQEVHQKADAIRKEIERKIGTWQEVLAEAEKKIFELREELAGAWKKVEEIEAARRSVCVDSVVEEDGVNLTVARMLCKIEEAISTIDEMAKLDIAVPDPIGMRLEWLMALPDDARSEIAASAYTELSLHVKSMKLVPKQLALLDRQVLDVVCLACCRFIDPDSKVETKKRFSAAFGGRLDIDLSSRLGNSLYQMFKRDFKAHPMKEPGSKHPEQDERPPRVRKRVQRVKRTTSEPISESRSMTGGSVKVHECLTEVVLAHSWHS